MQRIGRLGPLSRVLVSVCLWWLAIGPLGEAASAQQSGLAVLVDQIAGENVYIRAGTEDGIAVSDTLFVYDASGERFLGALFVLSATRTRAVLTFTDGPFLLTRGTTVLLAFEGAAAAADSVRSVQPPGRFDRASQASGYAPQVSGRLALQFNAVETTSRWLSNEEAAVAQRFGTPVLALRMAVTHLPGDVEFTTNLRGAYRYSSHDLVDPPQSLRIYQLGLTKSFARVPLQFQIGRFYNRFETYSGYWDGLLLHYGERGLGFGVAAGFEPERANEAFSTAVPKYAAFVDFNHVGASVDYYTDVSFHRLRLSSGAGDRTSLGWSQRLTVGRTRLASDLQVDRNGATDTWTISRLQTSGSVRITGRFSLRGRYVTDEPSWLLDTMGFPSFRRHQGSAGISYWGRGGSFRADVTANRVADRRLTYTFSSSFRLRDTPVFGLGFQGSGSYWTAESARAINVVGGLDRRFGTVQTHASYQLYRTEAAANAFLSHSIDLGVVLPLARRWYSTFQARFERGANQSANSLFVNLWMSF